MALVSKRRKSKQELNNSGDELRDRLSSLPDQLIVHILSFLPTKHAVGTCILSKRWEKLWASIPNLDFDQKLFLHPAKFAQLVPMFDNLTGLRLDFVYCRHFNVLPYLLKFSPKLQDLCLVRNDFFHLHDFWDTGDLMLPNREPNCLLFQLKFAKCFGRPDELNVIKYLVKNTKDMKEMNFYFADIIEPKEWEEFVSQTKLLSRRAPNKFSISEINSYYDCQCREWKSSEIMNYYYDYEDTI